MHLAGAEAVPTAVCRRGTAVEAAPLDRYGYVVLVGGRSVLSRESLEDATNLKTARYVARGRLDVRRSQDALKMARHSTKASVAAGQSVAWSAL